MLALSPETGTAKKRFQVLALLWLKAGLVVLLISSFYSALLITNSTRAPPNSLRIPDLVLKETGCRPPANLEKRLQTIFILLLLLAPGPGRVTAGTVTGRNR